MITQKIKHLKNYLTKKIFEEFWREKFFDLRRSKGYSGGFEKLTRDDSDLTITIMLKEAVKQKMKIRVTGYCQGEYLYTLRQDGLSMYYKEYCVKRQLDITTQLLKTKH